MIKYNRFGSVIDALGFGTWDLRGQKATEMVLAALEHGYRHIDTAQMYGNEVEVGSAINQSSVPRNEIFLTTKVWPDRLSKDLLIPSIEESLRKLNQDYVDLVLIHWPNPAVPLEESLEELKKAQDKGYMRQVGVSNFPIALLQKCLDFGLQPFCNQVEYHAMLDQSKLLGFMNQHDILLVAYCPLGQGKISGNQVLADVGAQYGKSLFQVALRWLLQQKNVLAIPRTSKVVNLQANFDVFDFELSEQDIAQINALQSVDGRVVNPDMSPAWDR